MSHIIKLSAFNDNYIWLVCDDDKKVALIVDPGLASPVLNYLKEASIQPLAILITHFHNDHTGGIAGILKQYPDIPVYAPIKENIERTTHLLSGNEKISFPALGLTIEVMNTFGHTAGHISYYIAEKTSDKPASGYLFCGDTLFAAGCGRVFNGTLDDLHDSLQTIKQLPHDTLIYCAHEYTLDNIGFAKWVEPNNEALLEREKETLEVLANKQATVPSFLSLELVTNPFLRTDEPSVIQKMEAVENTSLSSSSQVFSAMRRWKDSQYD